MKQSLILFLTFLFIAQISKAQTDKGSQTLGVNLGFNYYKQNGLSIDPADNSTTQQDTKNTTFDIGPNYSYFIADKLDIGAALSYSSFNYNSGTNFSPSKQHTQNYGGTVFLRKYFLYQNKLGFRAGPYLGYFGGDRKTTYSGQSSIYNSDAKSQNYEAGFNLDLVYYPSKCLGVSASLANLSYNHSKTNSGTQGHSNADQVNFDFISNGLALSVFYVFGGK